ncbi:hypothetical protein EPO56_01845 [Patescibacteria group bacterium]|nr:MAG: hypothetical protein EPO56_01845 [Patescibacteria group bacterium]
MRLSPFVNASLAALYIVGIAFTMGAFTSVKSLENTLLIPIGVLGLFVLSALTMGFLFIFEPLRLYFDNKKKEAVTFFFKTLGTFAVLVILYLVSILVFLR